MSEDLHLPIVGVPRMRRGERTRYVPNHRSFGAFMRSEQMRDVTEDVANDIAEVARATTVTKKGNASEHTGLHARVKSGYRVRRGKGMLKVAGNLRVMVVVENPVAGSAIVEFGGRGMRPRRYLARAGAKFGDLHAGKGSEL